MFSHHCSAKKMFLFLWKFIIYWTSSNIIKMKYNNFIQNNELNYMLVHWKQFTHSWCYGYYRYAFIVGGMVTEIAIFCSCGHRGSYFAALQLIIIEKKSSCICPNNFFPLEHNRSQWSLTWTINDNMKKKNTLIFWHNCTSNRWMLEWWKMLMDNDILMRNYFVINHLNRLFLGGGVANNKTV